MTTRTASTLSPRAAGIAAAVTACVEGALSLPANDNAGAAWAVADDKPYHCDEAFAVEVLDRNAPALAAALADAVPSLWRAYAVTYPRAAVRFRLAMPYCGSVNRRVRTLHAMLRAAGVAAEWG